MIKSRRPADGEIGLPDQRSRDVSAFRYLALAALAASVEFASAACPATEADGALLKYDGLQLAWRPLLKDEVPAAPTAIPMAQHFAMTVQLCEGNATSKARLTKIDATMPEHRHGMNYRPRVSALGDGRFRVDGMMFHMSGRWQLEFEVQRGKDELRLTHDVQIR